MVNSMLKLFPTQEHGQTLGDLASPRIPQEKKAGHVPGIGDTALTSENTNTKH